jgi:deoxyribodipyrimidine photolyase-related protein
VEQRVLQGAQQHGITLEFYESPLFINEESEIKNYFESQKRYLHHDFYVWQRKKQDILMEDGKPVGGQWSFDHDNRKRYPKTMEAPKIDFPALTPFWDEAYNYVLLKFPDNPGTSPRQLLYPINFQEAQDWLQQFLEMRFSEFGTYEDAMVVNSPYLHHSVFSPLMNCGLLDTKKVVEQTLDYAVNHNIPLNSTEGIIRQIIGWREFIRGLYLTQGRKQRTHNFWGFSRPMPKSFYDGTTGIEPVDHVIKGVLERGYCHHIERLMVLGNFMLLCEIEPDAVYRWFMELFVDAYDWVMVPNVYGMSQFADGGLMATKPYISGSNYLRKMSDFKSGKWEQVWDGLFWRFVNKHRSFFSKNPRSSLMVANFNRMTREKQTGHIRIADEFLDNLK